MRHAKRIQLKLLQSESLKRVFRACGLSACFSAVHRHLTSRGWAQHIVDRWRDAVTNRPTASHTTEIYLAVDEFLSDIPRRGGYHSMHVPGA